MMWFYTVRTLDNEAWEIMPQNNVAKLNPVMIQSPEMTLHNEAWEMMRVNRGDAEVKA